MSKLLKDVVGLTLHAILENPDGSKLDKEEIFAWLAELNPRKYRAIRALMDYSPLNKEGWLKPRDLYKAGVCGYTKTTDTWRELEDLDLIEVSKEPHKNRGRINHPTRIRLKTDHETIRRVMMVLNWRPEYFSDLLIDATVQPPQWWLDNAQAIKQALKDVKKRTR